ncbi:MAG: hypothetical protein ACTHOU_10840 [Aureliella sp.]
MRSRIAAIAITAGWIAAALVALVCFVERALAVETLPSEAGLSFEVRAVWGGGPVRAFAGTIKLDGGSIDLVRNLSVQDDSVASVVRRNGSELAIQPHSPSSFGGVDLRLHGTPQSELEFQWDDPSGVARPEPIRVKLAQLLHERVLEPIDGRGTRLAVERQVHDRIRASVNHGQTIFAPGERCTLTVEGVYNQVTAGEYRVNVRLIEGRDGHVVSHFQRDVEVDSSGSFAEQTFSAIDLPTEPGVYCFDIGIQRRRLINSFISAIAVADRKYEIVVVDDQPAASAPTEWRELAQVYPAGASWWDSLGRFRVPAVKTLTPLVSHASRPIGSAEHNRRLVGGTECMVLAAGAWQAFPLSIDAPGTPHRAIVTVPNDRAQKLVFSIQESASPGDASGLKLDSGLIVEPHTVGQGDILQHELVFWPKTSQPFLLVFNAGLHSDAAIAEINLEVAEAGLTSVGTAPAIETPGRLAAVYFDKPLLAENFGAARRVDHKGHRQLDSWRTVDEASQRLADYTRWSGHNAAVLTVATQGGACYPSQVLAPSPKFDSGTFLADGSSPEIKDLAELVCRQFDRRGLKLVLAIELEGKLPELARFEPANEVNGSLFQVEQEESQDTAREPGVVQRGPRYNPLDARVQAALARVVHELVERYGKHPCFAGVQINLSDRGHFNFAGDRWGYDTASLARFERSVGAPLPADPEQRQQLLAGGLRLDFLNERSQELARFYYRLADDVANSHPGAKLMINPAKLLAAAPSAETFGEVESRPLSPSEILLGCGIDPAALTTNDKICLLRPDADSPLRAPVARAWSYRLASDGQLDAAISAHSGGAILQQTPTGFRLPEFDKANPFGNETSRTWLFPHVSSAGDSARRDLVSRLFQADLQVLECGGWMAAMGQERALRPALQVLAQLPPVRMDDLTCNQASATLRVRRVAHAGHTYLQLVNNASWRENVVVELQSKRDTAVHSLDAPGADPLKNIPAGQKQTLQLSLSPYSLSGLRIDADDITILSLTSAPEEGVATRLERRLNDLQLAIDRAGELNEQQTLGLRGGDFEAWSDGTPQGWTKSTHPSTSVSEERELPRSGQGCVRIEHNGNGAATAWIQSDRIAIPSTGRLALEVWVRSAPGQDQPSVRLSVIGRDREGKRFQRWHDFVPSAAGGTQIPIDWGRKPLVLLVPDVPNEDLTELHVAVDLIGPGRLWVDDVRVYGMYLHPDEQVHLLGQMFLAKQQMRKGDCTLADQLLDGFWACFLSSYLGPPPTPAGAEALAAGTATADGKAAGDAANPPQKSSASPTASPTKSAGRPSAPTPAWRKSSQPRFNHWQEALRQRWQR